jgi:hypothetical protein
MLTFRRYTISFLPLLLLLLFSAVNAQAGLQAVGPTDAALTVPTWYQDTNSLALQPCLDQNGKCLLPGATATAPNFDPALGAFATITTTGPINNANFPGEGFYYSAQAIMPIEASGELANLAYVLEFAYLTGVSPNNAIIFLRTDLQKMQNLTPNSTYRVTHPYGTFDFTTDGLGATLKAGGVVVRQEDPSGSILNWMPAQMKSAAFTNIGPFLTPATGTFIVDLVTGHTYIGDPAVPVAVTGSPSGFNKFRIQRLTGPGGTPVAGASWETNLFALMGKVFTGQIPSPMTIDRVTYARDGITQQIDVFATALPSAVLSISGTGLAATPIAEDLPATGKFFAHIPVASMPTNLSVTNSLDIPPIPYPVTPVDEVIITQANFNPASRNLTIKAYSRDKVTPPTLSVPAFVAPNTLDGTTGTLVKAIAANTIPPEFITVTSSLLGGATVPISVVISPAPPVAVDDTAITAKNSAVTIRVLDNDTAAGGINQKSVAIVSAPAHGTAVPAGNGTIDYTPTASFTGSDTFTYTVKDDFDQTSNAATVTITVHAPPVAVNDTASAAISSTVNIDVIANDTAASSSINSTTVNIVSSTSCGSTTVLPNGTVNFTAPVSVPAAPGTCSFSYVVSDTFVPPSLSNVATVTVTITPPPAPVAVNDAASTTTGTPVIINVISNDTSAVSTINPATVAVNSTTGGTAAANANGTVTYTPPATTGTYTFTYTVKDNAATPLTSNVATVTVTVTAASPVALGDAATATVNSSISINVVANDTATPPAIINPASLVVTVPTGGTAVANANGTVTYTAPATPGTYTFTYTVKDNAATPLTSNSGTVTVTVIAAATGVSLVPSSASPQAPLTPITFIAAGSGGSGSYEYQFSTKTAGNQYVVARAYNSAGSWIWTPAATGAYDIKVDVRNAGSTSASEASGNVFFYQIQTPATNITIVPNLTAPQAPGTAITFTATATGGSGPYEYRFWANTGNGYAIAQDYNSANTWVFTPTKPGIYDILVDVRGQGSTVFRDAFKTLLSYQISPAPATAVTLTTPTASPRAVGTPITFTGTASGGTGPYEYRFWINIGGTFLIAQDYSTINTFTWTPLATGNYDLMVDTRAVGSTLFREALTKIFFYQIQ